MDVYNNIIFAVSSKATSLVSKRSVSGCEYQPPMNYHAITFRAANRPGSWALAILTAVIAAGCATTAPHQQQVAAPVSNDQQMAAQRQAALVVAKTLKRKVAIGRFTNETRYGRTFLVDANQDPLGKQATDMLSTRLVQTQKFLVFERPDLNKIQSEQMKLKDSNLIGVDALIVGSVTEFGRNTTGKAGFLSATKIQTAHAKVEIRLVDVRTGYVFFTASGTGDASTESGEIAGFGSKADYDEALNDRAIGAAISDVQGALVSKLEERPWRTDILKVDGRLIYISGGTQQGIKVGDTLAVLQQGDAVKSAQTGFEIVLPAKAIGRVSVKSLFGDNETNEGAVTELLSGTIADSQKGNLYIAEIKE
jgi:curli biogenesis system outer membrane secretion channel CsgG